MADIAPPSSRGAVNQYQYHSPLDNTSRRILQQQSSRFRGNSFELPREGGMPPLNTSSRGSSNVPASANSTPLPSPAQRGKLHGGWAYCPPHEVEQMMPGFHQQQQPQPFLYSTRDSCMSTASIESTIESTDMDVLVLESIYDPQGKPPYGAVRGSPPAATGLYQAPSLRRNNSTTSSSSGFCANGDYSFTSSGTAPSQLPPRPHAAPTPAQQQQQQQFQPRLAPMFDLLAGGGPQPQPHQPRQLQSHSSTISCPLPRFAPPAAARGPSPASKQQQLQQEAALGAINDRLDELILSEAQMQQLLEASHCWDDSVAGFAPLPPIVEGSSGGSLMTHHERSESSVGPEHCAAFGGVSHPAIGAYISAHSQQQQQHQSCMAAVAAAAQWGGGGLSDEAKEKLQQLLAAQQLQMELQAELLAMLPPPHMA